MIPEPLFYAAIAYAGWLVVGYVWMGLALGAVYRKFGGRAPRAWVPVLRYAEMAVLTQSGTAGVVTARVLAPLGAGAAVAGVVVGSGTGDALALGGLAVAVVASVAAWVLWVIHTRRLALDHALGTGYVVLAALLPALWAAVLGWGSAGASTATGPIPLVAAGSGERRRDHQEPDVGAGPAATDTAADVATDAADAATDAATDAAAAATDIAADQHVEGTSMDTPAQEPAADTQPIEGAAPPPPTDTVPIPVRRSPYADLAPRDLEPVEPPVRRSRYADLAARELPPEPVPATPTFLMVPPTAPPETEDIPVPVEAAPAEPETVDPASVDTAPIGPMVVEPEPEPEPASSTVAEAEHSSPAPLVDPTPSVPVSPYMRGGAAAPPEVPSVVPSFELPAPAPDPAPAPGPAPDPGLAPAEPDERPGVAALPEVAPRPAPEPVPAPVPAPEPPVDEAPAPPPEALAEPAPEPDLIAPAPAPPVPAADPPAATIDAPPAADAVAGGRAGGVALGAAGVGAMVPQDLTAEAPPAVQDAAEDDRTQVSARVRERWELVTPEGRAYALTSARVLVGRAGGFPPLDGTPRLDLDDATRTVSKSHARLALDHGRWTVEDLGSTNGTYLIDALGRESQVEPGAARPVEGRLAFGDVELELRRRDGS